MDIYPKPGSLKEDKQYYKSQGQWVNGVLKEEVHDSSLPVISQKVPSVPSPENPVLDPKMLVLFFLINIKYCLNVI